MTIKTYFMVSEDKHISGAVPNSIVPAAQVEKEATLQFPRVIAHKESDRRELERNDTIDTHHFER
jgi:hypothetical protein